MQAEAGERPDSQRELRGRGLGTRNNTTGLHVTSGLRVGRFVFSKFGREELHLSDIRMTVTAFPSPLLQTSTCHEKVVLETAPLTHMRWFLTQIHTEEYR